MSLQGNYNATITITRKTRSGTEDGTPIYSPSVVVVAGWFDAIDVRTMDTPFRDLNVAYVDRRALFLCDAGADIQQDDVGIIAIGGYDQGQWQVSDVRTAPIPGGVGHLECQLQGVKESI